MLFFAAESADAASQRGKNTLPSFLSSSSHFGAIVAALGSAASQRTQPRLLPGWKSLPPTPLDRMEWMEEEERERNSPHPSTPHWLCVRRSAHDRPTGRGRCLARERRTDEISFGERRRNELCFTLITEAQYKRFSESSTRTKGKLTRMKERKRRKFNRIQSIFYY